MGLAPPAVVDAVIMISGTRYGGFVEIRILKDSGGRHESASRVPVNAYAVDVDVFVACRQLLYRCLMVGKGIVAHVSVSVVVIPFRTAGMSSALPYRNHDKAGLRQAVGAYAHAGKRIIDRFYLRTRIYVVDYRIDFGRIEIIRLVHHAIEVGHTIGSFYRKEFGELVACGKKLGEIAFLQIHHLISVAVYQDSVRNGIYPRIIVYDETRIVIHVYLVEVFAFGQELQSASVGIYFIQVFVIRIFVRFASVGSEVDGAGGRVYLHDTLYVPRPFGDAVFQVSLVII